MFSLICHWPICHQHAVFVFPRLSFSPLSSASLSVNLFCSLPPFLLVRGSIINNAWLCNTLTEQISQQVAVMIVVWGPVGITQHCVLFCLIMKVPASALLHARQQLCRKDFHVAMKLNHYIMLVQQMHTQGGRGHCCLIILRSFNLLLPLMFMTCSSNCSQSHRSLESRSSVFVCWFRGGKVLKLLHLQLK